MSEMDDKLEEALAENLALRQVLTPFALFAKPAAVELAGGDPDKIGAVVVGYEHQSLVLGAFQMAREVYDELSPVTDAHLEAEEARSVKEEANGN